MPNIEIKARTTDLTKARVTAQKLQTRYIGFLHQIDTYFHTPSGRLKLREIDGKTFQLIPYAKDYKAGPMRSDYALIEISDAALVKTLFDRILGIEAVVDKRREVFLIDNVRVHLDEVAGLGTFIEFEAVYGADEEVTAQTEKVARLMETFGIRPGDLCDRSYVDYLLVAARGNVSPSESPQRSSTSSTAHPN